MYQDVTDFKPLFLSEEETMALLDLCLTSASAIDENKERAIRKLTELARSHMRQTECDAHPQSDAPLSAAIADAPVPPCDAAAPARRDASAPARRDIGGLMREGLTPVTMMARSMARSHTPRQQMSTALIDCRRRLRKGV